MVTISIDDPRVELFLAAWERRIDEGHIPTVASKMARADVGIADDEVETMREFLADAIRRYETKDKHTEE